MFMEDEMEKEDLDKYFAKSDIETKSVILDGPEYIAETERMNKEMRKVVREYNHRAFLSWKLARDFYFTR